MTTWRIHSNEIDSVLRMPGGQRYTYLIKKIADWREIWGLANDDGWVQMMDDDGNSLAPIWPHEEFARRCAIDDWVDTIPRLVDLNSWRNIWIPGLSIDDRLIAAFPTPDSRGGVITPLKFKSDLEQELSLYE